MKRIRLHGSTRIARRFLRRRAARTGDNGPGPGGCSHPRSAVVGLRGPLEPLAARPLRGRRLSLAGPDRSRFVRVNRFGPIIAAARRQVKPGAGILPKICYNSLTIFTKIGTMDSGMTKGRWVSAHRFFDTFQARFFFVRACVIFLRHRAVGPVFGCLCPPGRKAWPLSKYKNRKASRFSQRPYTKTV